MKFIQLSIIAAGFIAGSADASSLYTLQSVPHADIDQYLTVGSDLTATPQPLQGLWWMDGNPLADEVVSFASAQFEERVNGAGESYFSAEVPVYDEGVWSWHDSFAGRVLYELVRTTKLVYSMEFNMDYSQGQVLPNFKPIDQLPQLRIEPSPLLDFQLNRVSETEYARNSIVAGQNVSYRFRQIVDGSGERLPAYADYLAAIAKRGPLNALLPICKIDLTDQLPTACAN